MRGWSFFDNPAPKKPVKLEELPTFAEAAKANLDDFPVPEDYHPYFAVNEEINKKVSFWMRGDSSRLAADAVVNAANSELMPGGGICGVLHSAAGHEMAVECRTIGHTPTGEAAITKGYNLPAKYCIHAVGPIGEKPAKLVSAYRSVLKYINGEDLRSVGLCCISTGIYGYPIKPATHIALRVVREFLEDPANLAKTDRIIFVVFERRDVEVYRNLARFYFPVEGAPEPVPISQEEGSIPETHRIPPRSSSTGNGGVEDVILTEAPKEGEGQEEPTPPKEDEEPAPEKEEEEKPAEET